MQWTDQLKQLASSLIRTDHPESPQLVVVLSASAVLILSSAAVVLSCARCIVRTGDLGAGAVTALGLAVGSITGLAIHSSSISSRGDQ